MDFSLPITSGGEFKLSELTKPLVLFFYPRDNTPGCTVENQDFSRLYPEFIKAGYEVLGISRDKHITHCNFQKKHALTHQLLADPEETVCNLFNVMKDKTMYGKPVRGIERSTFILDKEKNIIKEWRKVTVDNHAEEVLEFIKSLG
ncbi:peroxiredoxin [Aquella oligotrophica]|uniref:thioredoxin-dependent peroxiredoxin n=1 Tax=Aquella oligotrophica TaxID=2067065 RepID=A0A2I7N5T8_9NEIS|nr:peroxiredoxin [Aquella oligotrophica]AUR51833.1 peroxiredoxin [Aquella oligotrophica]